MIRKISRNALNALGCPDCELSLVLVDNPQIATINRDYLDREGPTNVIAFPMREGAFGEISPELLGDVVISMETTAAEARHANLPITLRFCQLLVHGILHLLGYDHEDSQKDATRMEKKSREVLQSIMAADGSSPGFSNMITEARAVTS